jgi:hypothetical protein
MPYIASQDRSSFISNPDCDFHLEGNYLDTTIDEVILHLQKLPEDKREGTANYIISRVVAGGLKPEGGWRYMWLNRAYGTFLSAAAEFNRRVMIPYENKCIKKSGDIPEYEEFPVE